ncbi:MAG: D-alanyl-D-alanine carboxypeptidase/D-alanyl-D-alanine-endopeptidase [Legionellaceae bacterium]|nr:D-alanyl-D-alanine carboxypeptidase/D-alanyl-D-alanine-endopeptidase [Legionellaceae bacterium]
MKRTQLILAVVLVLCSNVFAGSLQEPINNIINKVDPQINMGMMVEDLNTGEILYKRNANKTFTPASNMKLFSEAAALIYLGPGYTFQTSLSTDATSLKDGVLNGSIFLVLSGDPSFNHKDLKNLISQLPGWGIKKITGNFVIVSNNSKIKPHAPGVDPKDFTHSYGAPITPIMLDENRVTVTVNPSSHGKNAIIEYSSLDNSFTLDNKVITKTKGRCGVSAKITKKNNLRLRGCVRENSQAIQLEIPISNPMNYAKEVVRHRLDRVDIKLDGKVRLGELSKPTLLLAKHSSKPITQLMANTLKFSDNLYADGLFLHAANKINGSPLNWQQAEPVIKKFLHQQTGVNLENAVLVDGAGLSLHDLLTPQQTMSLLKYIHARFPLAYEYITALPIAGQDGTLSKRFRKPTQKGLLRAKTGRLTGVISLSGYLYTSNAHTLAFTIYINTRPGTKPSVSGKYLNMVDSLCNFLLTQKPDNTFISATKSPHEHVAFQQNPSKTERVESSYAKWRGIERTLKHSLKSQSASVLFRNDSILIIDNNVNAKNVWDILKPIQKKKHFSIGLKTANPPALQDIPVLLWLDKNPIDGKRVWYLQESVG